VQTDRLKERWGSDGQRMGKPRLAADQVGGDGGITGQQEKIEGKETEQEFDNPQEKHLH
jgi:hypothetical protein